MLKLIVPDFDGTLLPTNPYWRQTWNWMQQFSRIKFPSQKELVRKYNESGEFELWEDERTKPHQEDLMRIAGYLFERFVEQDKNFLKAVDEAEKDVENLEKRRLFYRPSFIQSLFESS